MFLGRLSHGCRFTTRPDDNPTRHGKSGRSSFGPPVIEERKIDMVSSSGLRSLYQGVVFSRTTTSDPIVSAGLLPRALLWLLTCNERRRQRHALATLSDHQLADIGLSRADVRSEIEKWPW